MSAFESLVRPALVRIAAPGDGYDPHGDRYWGSGFFIAPGWVLTCAHVVAKGGGAVWRGERAVGIVWDGGVTTGEVALASPRPAVPEQGLDTWDFPDLALVRVPDVQDVSCVRLSERMPVIAEPIQVSLHGWSRETGRLAIRDAVGEIHGVDGEALLLRGTQPVKGLSGGPVVDLARAAVVGLNKGRGADEGAAVPITSLRQLYRARGGRLLSDVIREHDRHHLARYRSLSEDADWTRAQIGHRPPAVTGLDPGPRIHLYGRLAELPPPGGPGDVLHLVDVVRELTVGLNVRPLLEDAPHTWREGVGLLQELHDPNQEPEPASGLGANAALVYAARVARHVRERHGDSAAVRSLGAWVTDAAAGTPLVVRQTIAGLLGPGRRGGARAVPDAGSRADVLIEIDSPRYVNLFPWRVKLLFDGHTIRPVDGNDVGVEREKLYEALRQPLATALALGDCGEHLAAVEALLPRELFDEPLDTWRLSPDDELFDERSLPLGQRRIVVVRDRARNERPPSPEWHKRWRTAGRGPLTAVPLRAETLGAGRDAHTARVRRETPRQAWVRLSEAEDGSVPVFCGRVGSGEGLKAMAAALAAGHPIALWRTGAHDHADCVDFHERAGRLLAGAGRAEVLHAPVLSLRKRVAADADVDTDAYDDFDPDPETDAATNTPAGIGGEPSAAPSEHAWASTLAVLFDPPDRPPREDPLQGPPMLGEESW